MRPWTRDPWTVLVTAAAAYRITRLLTEDQFPPLVRARQVLAERLPDEWAYGITCPWCVGLWVSAATVAAVDYAHRRAHHDTALLLALPWALSAATGTVADRETT